MIFGWWWHICSTELKQSIALVWDLDSRGGCVCVEVGNTQVFSAQIYWEPKTALKFNFTGKCNY